MENFTKSKTKIKNSVQECQELSSQNIHITGDVASNSIIEANKLLVDGITEEDSSQFARFATINTHRGILRCHDAQIDRLEGGDVHATKATIKSCVSGSVFAQDVIIENIGSNLKIYASHSITIDSVDGKNNRLKINYHDIPILHSKIDLIVEDIDNLNERLEEANRHNKSIVQDIQNRIKILEDEKSSIYNSYKIAEISIKKSLHDSNSIIFTIDTDHEITFNTQAQQYTPFFLEIDKNKITLQPVNQTLEL